MPERLTEGFVDRTLDRIEKRPLVVACFICLVVAVVFMRLFVLEVADHRKTLENRVEDQKMLLKMSEETKGALTETVKAKDELLKEVFVKPRSWHDTLAE